VRRREGGGGGGCEEEEEGVGSVEYCIVRIESSRHYVSVRVISQLRLAKGK
jgi:hypothetical protein